MRLAGRQHGFASDDLAIQYFALLLSLTAFPPLSHAQDVTTSASNSGNPVPLTTASPAAPTPASTLPSAQTTSLPAPPEPTSPHAQSIHSANVFNYYFLFLFLFAVLVAIFLLYFHRKRQQRKQLLRQNGQHALARDLEGWAGTRRFMHGRYGVRRREEGLDERGEAPPPYDGKSGDGVAVPLRAVVREREEEPPGYEATQNGDGVYSAGRPRGT